MSHITVLPKTCVQDTKWRTVPILFHLPGTRVTVWITRLVLSALTESPLGAGWVSGRAIRVRVTFPIVLASSTSTSPAITSPWLVGGTLAETPLRASGVLRGAVAVR